jgi:enoyl-CoA hydratase
MSSSLIFSKKKHLGLITLNRPQALNALTHEMICDLSSQLKIWAQDPEVQIVVIRSDHERAFCAGGDVRSLYELGRQSSEAPLRFFKDEYQLNYLIAHYPKPYIPLLNGITFGGGVGISLHSDYAVADENFLFAMPETSIGFFPDVGASYLLSKCAGATGIYLGLTGARVTAKEALALKLIRRIIPLSKFEILLEDLFTIEPKKNVAQQVEERFQQYQMNQGTPLHDLKEINLCFESDSIEKIKSNLEKSNTPWAIKTLNELNQKSPMSLNVTLEQLKRAKNSSLQACLTMDYVLVYHFMRHQDFFEGVRALLIDKDKSPQWFDVPTSEGVMDYFELPDSTATPMLDLA